MILNIKDICQGLPGLSKTSGAHLFEGCVVCLSRHNHNPAGTTFSIYGDEEINYQITWENIFDDQLNRTWNDQVYATEHGAVCLAILIALKMTRYTIIEKSPRMNGFDYWLGDKNDIPFQKKARLEISGIFRGTEQDVNKRYRVKIKQTDQSDSLGLPAYIGIVEFSNPMANFGIKK
ncbi:hypothetical protein VU07_01785 [Desulfobulbus sp. F4]|nr:hypothetical protein [Desulfobulbus sp. F3]MCW5200537.1 hypothetical protein [Desulfobulbus sp. F4]